MGMGSYKSAVVVGLGHSRCELIDTKLDAVEVLPLGKDAAACHDRDEVYVFGEHGPDSSSAPSVTIPISWACPPVVTIGRPAAMTRAPRAAPSSMA